MNWTIPPLDSVTGTKVMISRGHAKPMSHSRDQQPERKRKIYRAERRNVMFDRPHVGNRQGGRYGRTPAIEITTEEAP